MDAVDAELRCGDGILRVVVDIDRIFRRDAVALEENVVDARSG